MPSKYALRIEGFSFSYNKKKIIDDISLSVQAGEYVSIIGANGAGKSTLIKCINRILKDGKGKIEIFGEEIKKFSQKILGQLIGYVPQSSEPSFSYTVREFVTMGRYPYLNPFTKISKDDKKVVDEVIEMTALEAVAERSLQHLSGGEKQKVYIAACLAQQPKILLLDEPTNHLDPRHQLDIQRTISDISKKLGITILQITHDLNHCVYWSQKIIALKEGKVVGDGPPHHVITTSTLRKIFDTDFHIISDPLSKRKIVVPKY